MPKGGFREGSGRKPIDGAERKQRQVRCSNEEWELIKAFDKILKYGNKIAAKEFIAKFKIS